jgi:Flp pilus assembly protein TadG
MHNSYKNNRGQILVLVAISLVVLLGFAALAIDVGYFYHTKNQLQGAADAAALAGAIMLDTASTPTSIAPRQEAWKFACKNSAAGQAVYLVTNSSTNCDSPPTSGLNEDANDPTGDIVLGNWEATRPEDIRFLPTASAPLPSTSMINAVKVTTRRTNTPTSPGGPVQTFFGKIFNITNVDISAQAIATRPPKPSTSMSLCINACLTQGTTTTFYFKEGDDLSPGKVMTSAWTEYTGLPATNFGPDSDIAQYIQGKKIPPSACCQMVTTNQSGAQQIMKVLQDEFNKRKNADGYWEIIIPIFGNDLTVCPGQIGPSNSCPPGGQPDPYVVSRYARAKLYDVILNPTPSVKVNIVECVPCPATGFLGELPNLVK